MGSVSLPASTVYQELLAPRYTTSDYAVLWNLRLPRTLLAAIVGIHFALSGLILQSVVRNPLADPSVMGVSGGASMAVVIFLIGADIISGLLIDGSTATLSLSWLPFAALIGGLLTAIVVLRLSWQGGIDPIKLALNGVAVGAILTATVMWIVVALGGNRTETTILWLAGSLYGRDFSHLINVLPWTVISLLALIITLPSLSLMRFDDNVSQSLGLHIHRWRVIAISIAVALAASATAVVGPIGFVGLIVPHMVRLLVGSHIGQLTVISLLSGACLTLGADILSRMLISPLELPAGVLTTLIGIPLLLVVLQRHTGKYL